MLLNTQYNVDIVACIDATRRTQRLYNGCSLLLNFLSI